MQTLNFNINYNGKLHNDIFTTIRLDSDKFQIGENYIITLNKVHVMPYLNIKIIDKKIFLLKHLPPITLQLDTGYNYNDSIDLLKKIYKNANWETDKLCLLLLKYV